MVRIKKPSDAVQKGKSKQQGVDFDPRPKPLHNDSQLLQYLSRFGHKRGLGVEIHICRGEIDFSEAAPGGAYIFPLWFWLWGLVYHYPPLLERYSSITTCLPLN